MEKVTLIARYLLALMLLVFGLNKFLGFMPMMDYSNNPEAAAYMTGIGHVGMFKILGVIYILAAISLASNKLVGLSCVVMAAVAFNILTFHLALDPANILPGLILTILLVLTMIGNKPKLLPLLR